jgi:hypothetical protein
MSVLTETNLIYRDRLMASVLLPDLQYTVLALSGTYLDTSFPQNHDHDHCSSMFHIPRIDTRQEFY